MKNNFGYLIAYILIGSVTALIVTLIIKLISWLFSF